MKKREFIYLGVGLQRKTCQKCKIDFKKGDIVNNSNNAQNVKSYHKKCYEMLLH